MGTIPVSAVTDDAARRVAKRNEQPRTQTYFTVEQNGEILHHYFSLEFELFTTLSGAVALLPELAAKFEMSHAVHTAMLRTAAIRGRLVDFLMREPEKKVKPEWANFVRHLMTAPSAGALLAALYRVVRPAQLNAYEAHRAFTLPVNDAPTREMFDMYLPAMRADVDWWTGYLAEKEKNAGGKSVSDGAFEELLKGHLNELGGPMGVMRPAGGAGVQEFAAWVHPPHMALEARFEIQSADRFTLPQWPAYEAIPTAYTHFTELPVIDIVGVMIYKGRAQGMPFEFFADFARQLWDEARHTQMGMERLEAFGVDPYKVPIPVGHYDCWANMSLLHSLASLTQVGEGCSFAPKREWVSQAWKRDDALSALEHEYDIVDERMHVTFGSKWIKYIMKATNEQRDTKTVVQDADWEFRGKINAYRKEKGEAWSEDLGERFQGCGTSTSPVSLAPALNGIPNIIA